MTSKKIISLICFSMIFASEFSAVQAFAEDSQQTRALADQVGIGAGTVGGVGTHFYLNSKAKEIQSSADSARNSALSLHKDISEQMASTLKTPEESMKEYIYNLNVYNTRMKILKTRFELRKQNYWDRLGNDSTIEAYSREITETDRELSLAISAATKNYGAAKALNWSTQGRGSQRYNGNEPHGEAFEMEHSLRGAKAKLALAETSVRPTDPQALKEFENAIRLEKAEVVSQEKKLEAVKLKEQFYDFKGPKPVLQTQEMLEAKWTSLSRKLPSIPEKVSFAESLEETVTEHPIFERLGLASGIVFVGSVGDEIYRHYQQSHSGNLTDSKAGSNDGSPQTTASKGATQASRAGVSP